MRADRRLRRALVPGLLVPGLLVLALVSTACEAPLKPESRSESRSGSAPAPGATAATPSARSTPSPTSSTRPTPSPRPRAAPSPRVTVPPSLDQRAPLAPVLGGDASWPQCPRGMGIPEKRSEGLPLPDASARFVVLGLTNGPGFVANPCLADQVAWARSRHLLVAAYSVVSGPTRFSGTGRSPDRLGYDQARFNLATMRKVGLQTPVVWLDVETVPHFDWGPDTAANAAVVAGAARAYREAGYRVGVYSTPYLYARVAGGLRLGVPEWRAAGQTSRAEALRRCGRDWRIQGGPGVLAQWVEGGRDRNTTCPGAVTDLTAWFHQY